MMSNTNTVNSDGTVRIPPCSDLVNADAIGKHLGVSARTALRMARDGEIPSIRLGRFVRFDIEAVDESLKRR